MIFEKRCSMICENVEGKVGKWLRRGAYMSNWLFLGWGSQVHRCFACRVMLPVWPLDRLLTLLRCCALTISTFDQEVYEYFQMVLGVVEIRLRLPMLFYGAGWVYDGSIHVKKQTLESHPEGRKRKIGFAGAHNECSSIILFIRCLGMKVEGCEPRALDSMTELW